MKKLNVLSITFIVICIGFLFNNVAAATSAKAGNRAPTISTSSGKTEVTVTVKDTDGIKSINIYKYNSSTKKWDKINNLNVTGSATSKKFTLKEGTYQIVAKDSCKTPLTVKSKISIKKSTTKMSTNSSPKITILNKPYGASYAYQGAGKNKNVIYALVSDGNGIKGITVTDQNKKKVNATIKKLASGKESLYSIVLPDKNKDATKYRIKVIDNSKSNNYRIEQVMIATKVYKKPKTTTSSSSSKNTTSSSSSSKNTTTSSSSSSKDKTTTSSSNTEKSNSSSKKKSSKKTTSYYLGKATTTSYTTVYIRYKVTKQGGKTISIKKGKTYKVTKSAGTIKKGSYGKIMSSSTTTQTRTRTDTRPVTYYAGKTKVGTGTEKRTVTQTRTTGSTKWKTKEGKWKETSKNLATKVDL